MYLDNVQLSQDLKTNIHKITYALQYVNISEMMRAS